MRTLITGATGNVGTACLELANELHWEHVEIARALGINLCSWPKTNLFIFQQQPFDLVIMAHGFQNPMRIAEYTDSSWHTIVDGNLGSCASLLNALVVNKKLYPGSLLVFMSSIQAVSPRAGRGAYAAAKAGVEALMKTAAAELAPKTRAVALRMGQLTTMMDGVQFSEEERKNLEKRALLPWVAPYDVARLCFDLYKQSSLTGAVIDLDSGHGRNVW
jgi:3-oxoacyl-[acyl-carrier protein] reductase